MSKAKEILDHLENVLISEEQITIKYGDKNHSDIAEANKEIAELNESNTWVSVDELQTTECIHPLDKLRIIGGNISCLECKGYWKRSKTINT